MEKNYALPPLCTTRPDQSYLHDINKEIKTGQIGDFSEYSTTHGQEMAQDTEALLSSSVVVNVPTEIVDVEFTSKPQQNIKCAYCQTESAATIASPGYETCGIVWAILIARFGIIGCSIIPLYFNGFKKTEHHCPHCRKKLGIYRRNQNLKNRFTANFLSLLILLAGVGIYVVVIWYLMKNGYFDKFYELYRGNYYTNG